LRPEVPVELDLFLQSMVDRDPARRPSMPMSVARILETFLASGRCVNGDFPVSLSRNAESVRELSRS